GLGRSGEAVKVRGMFLHPRQVTAVMAQVSAVAAYRFLIDRVEHRDVLRCEVVPAAEGIDHDHLAGEVHDTIRSGLRFDVEVAVVSALEGGGGTITDLRSWVYLTALGTFVNRRGLPRRNRSCEPRGT